MDIALGSVKLTVNPTTQADVWQAIVNDQPFPDRAISFGDIQASYADAAIPIDLGGGAHVSLTASFSVGGQSGIGVYGSAADAMKSLGWDASAAPNIPANADHRFLVLGFSATAQGSVTGSAPIGVLGAATFGAKAAGATRFAILYRFDAKTTGARTALEQAGTCIKLPRSVQQVEDLRPGAWVMAEADGSLALSMAAKVGYDYTYTRNLPAELVQAGLSNQVSINVDAAAKASVGYKVSGRYLVMVGRPSLTEDQTLALQVNKGSSYGYNFGLDLTAGVQLDPLLPGRGEDLVAASFHVFGPQIVADVSKSIAALEAWSSGDLAANTAALTISTAKSLLSATTGINVDTALAQATGKLKDALATWNGLVGQGSTELQKLAWDLLGDPADKALIITLLTDLRDSASFSKALSDGLQSLTGQSWLMGIAEAAGAASPLSLGTHQQQVQKIAGYALAVLSDGGQNVLARLRKYILDRFHLTDVIATATDPSRLDQWVQDRLSAFLNKQGLSSSDLKNIQTSIHTLLSRFDGLYAKVTTALTNRYSFQFAAAYENTVENATLLDLSFDVSDDEVLKLYRSVLGGNSSAVFQLAKPLQGLTIGNAVMSHGIHTAARTSLAMPGLSSQTTALNDSVARLVFEQNGANLVGYLDATDHVSGDRFSSMLRLALKVGVKGGAFDSISESLAYELRTVASNASKAMVAQATAPFVASYFGTKFAPNEYSDKLLTDFDHAVDLPSSEFGDMLMSMQVAIDGAFLSAWMVPADQLNSAKLVASRAVQQFLRGFSHTLYFRQPSRIDTWATLPLLVWQSLPICTGTDWDPSRGTLSNTNTGKATYFEVDDGLIKALVNASSASGHVPPTWGTLDLTVAFACQEAIAAGISHPRFLFLPAPAAAQHIIGYVQTSPGFTQLKTLVLGEAAVIQGVVNAMDKLQAATASASANDPSALVDSLAGFGREITSALNQHMTNLFAGDELRLFGPMLFVELTRALAGARSAIQPKAMLQMKSLRAGHAFNMSTYIGGSEPSPDQVAVAQTLVSI